VLCVLTIHILKNMIDMSPEIAKVSLSLESTGFCERGFSFQVFV